MAELSRDDGSVAQAVIDAFEKTQKLQEGTDFSQTLHADWVQTPVGTLLAAADDKSLYLLSFVEQTTMVRKAALIQKKLKARIELGANQVTDAAKREISDYFAGNRRVFETPLAIVGTAFQIKVWEALREVPFGATTTYADLAVRLGKPAAFRAVAQANAQNSFAIMIPQHRVINAEGDLGGNGAELERKRRLLDFEKEVLERGA